jgi:hypothetical protein
MIHDFPLNAPGRLLTVTPYDYFQIKTFLLLNYFSLVEAKLVAACFGRVSVKLFS